MIVTRPPGPPAAAPPGYQPGKTFASWREADSSIPAATQQAADNSTARAITKITRVDLIVGDDIGMLPAGQDAADALYRVIDAAAVALR